MSTQTQVTHLYDFGSFRLDTAERQLLRDGEPVRLTSKAYEMLVVLVERRGHIVEKDELLREVWPDAFVEEGNLTQHVFALRRALGEGRDEHRYIETVSRRGYRFVASVRDVVADESAEQITEKHIQTSLIIEQEDAAATRDRVEQIVKQQEPGASSGQQRWTSWKLGRAFLIVCVLLVGLPVALSSFWVPRKREEPETAKAVRSLAVLPFKPIGAGTSDDYLGPGMADALIIKLSNIRQIAVRPTSAVLKYSGQDPLAAGRELKADLVLEGSIQQAGESIRVTVQLVSAREGTPLWAEKFDEQFTNIFAVQDRVSEQVARALMLKLTEEERKRLTKRHTENLAAYQLYLKGHYFRNKRTNEGVEKAVECFRQAIDIDPNYALAYTGLADSYGRLSALGMLPQKEAMPKAKAAAIKALEIDDTLAEAHTSLAFVKARYDWDWAGAEREYKRAIELDPNYPQAHRQYALVLLRLGRFDEALAGIKQAMELEPYSLQRHQGLGQVFYYARQYDQALEQGRILLELDPKDGSGFWLAYLHKGMYEEAIAELRKEVAGRSNPVSVHLGYAYAVAGKRDEAQKVIDKLNEQSNQQYVSAFSRALIYAGLGEKDQAFDWLEKSYQAREREMSWIRVDPKMDNLRTDPRFANLLQRIGLSP